MVGNVGVRGFLLLGKIKLMDHTQKLNAAFKTSDRAAICEALFGLIHSTGNVQAFALKAGLDRTMLYRSFKRNLRFDIVLKVMRAADLKLFVARHPALRAAFETNEIALISQALKDALRTQENITRHYRYMLIRPPRIPRLDSILCALNALGLQLTVKNTRGHGSS